MTLINLNQVTKAANQNKFKNHKMESVTHRIKFRNFGAIKCRRNDKGSCSQEFLI